MGSGEVGADAETKISNKKAQPGNFFMVARFNRFFLISL
jgi:hypothetical protein